mgnify:CR=1 FL=1
MTPKISVGITSYNQKYYLIEAIESVLSQTLPPTQIIIVDDNSIDGSKEIIQAYAELYPDLILPVLHKENIGISKSRTEALNFATEDYFAFLDGDDLFFPTKLEKEYNLLQQYPKVKIAFSNYVYIDNTGNCLGEWAEKPPPQGNVFVEVFSRSYPKGSLYRNELVDYQEWRSIGFFDPHINLYEDYEMRIRLSFCLETVYTDEVLCAYRRHPFGLSKAQKINHFLALEYIYHKNYHLLRSKKDKVFVDRKIKPLIAKQAKISSLELTETLKINLITRKYLAVKYFLISLKYDWKVIEFKFLLKLLTRLFC